MSVGDRTSMDEHARLLALLEGFAFDLSTFIDLQIIEANTDCQYTKSKDRLKNADSPDGDLRLSPSSSGFSIALKFYR